MCTQSETLAAVPIPEPSPIHRIFGFPDAVVKKGLLSDPQLVSLVLSSARFMKPKLDGGARPGFFLGDGAGVGKGRQVASAIFNEFAKRGGCKRHIWVSVSADLVRTGLSVG